MISIRSFIPNTITCLNLLSGSVACILAFHHQEMMAAGLMGFQWAYIAIGLAAVFDFMDGAVARLLHAYSLVGKELDSLSDLVSFGLAPALIMFNYMMAHTGGSLLSFVALWIVVMGALRLARFNVDDRQTSSFIGLPIPANALFWIGAVQFFMDHGYPGTTAMTLLLVIFPLLMVCNLKLFSLKFKNFTLRENYRRYILMVACAGFLLTTGVAGLAWTVVFYILLALVAPAK